MKQIKKIVQIEDERIEVTYKAMKSIRLKFNQKQGEFKLSAPYFLSEKQVLTFLESKRDWIIKNRELFNKRPLVQNLNYTSGEQHWYLGQQYTLEVRTVEKHFGCSIVNGCLVLQVPFNCSKEERQNMLYHFYRLSLKSLLPDIIQKWEEVIGVSSSSFLVRKMKTRWGTCNIRSKRITINLELIKHPKINIEHVVVHELVHLLERGHTKRFYGFLDQFQPGWRNIDADIKKRGLEC